MPLLYGELRKLAAHHMQRERSGHTLQTTALVHEVYLRLFEHAEFEGITAEHFLALAAATMRRVLVDHSRKHAARGGRTPRVALADVDPSAPAVDTDLLAVEGALAKLATLSERRARIVELRFFGGLSIDGVAREMGLSPRTVDTEWHAARDWLAGELEPR